MSKPKGEEAMKEDPTSQAFPSPRTGVRRPFAIVVESRLPRQLPLTGMPSSRPPSTKLPRRPSRSLAALSLAHLAQLAGRGGGASRSTQNDVLAAVQLAIESRGEHLVLEPDAHPPRTRTKEVWLSPTQADLRYGDVCIVRTASETTTLVRVSSRRMPPNRPPGKRVYRRWHGIDILVFLLRGARREVRIAQVLKGSRC